jgi:hypothetical protein
VLLTRLENGRLPRVCRLRDFVPNHPFDLDRGLNSLILQIIVYSLHMIGIHLHDLSGVLLYLPHHFSPQPAQINLLLVETLTISITHSSKIVTVIKDKRL